MTVGLPRAAQDAFDRFITCEYTTVDGTGQPITWPVTPYYEPGEDCIDVTTGVGYPKKADDTARHPKVSLLFSDPTGSGLADPAAVLVQGIAEVDDRDLEANRERYWRESAIKLPATVKLHPPKALRGMFSWYYARIYVHVRPERVFFWHGGDFAAAPELLDARMEEVRSGHIEEPPEPHPPPPEFAAVWDSRMDELADRYENAVVSWLGPDGFPLSARLPVSPDAGARRIHLTAEPGGAPLIEGRACLTAHRHAADFAWQENFQVRGVLAREPGGWVLIPSKMVGGFELPDESRLAVLKRNFKKARRFRKIYKERIAARK